MLFKWERMKTIVDLRLSENLKVVVGNELLELVALNLRKYGEE